MKYFVTTFPDGQVSVKITETAYPQLTFRINTYTDLMILAAIGEALNNQNLQHTVDLFIPCMFGQRSDRRFDPSASFDLKIICQIINACQFRSVSILDPHSDVCLALIDRSVRVSPMEYVMDAVEHLDAMNLFLISPDAGAYKKVHAIGQDLGTPVIAANKFRSHDGEIFLQFSGSVEGRRCLIVDDLADGGGTFEILAHKLKTSGAESVFLYVTHGFFFKGFDHLKIHIDRVFCTDSARTITDDFVTQFQVKGFN